GPFRRRTRVVRPDRIQKGNYRRRRRACENTALRPGWGRDEMGLFRYRTPSGEVRPWTLREIIQGRPINRPTHPMLVFFPIAFWVGALAFDVLSRLGLTGGPLTATWTIGGGLGVAAFAILTGTVDRSLMRPGSRIRKVATR